MLKVVRDDDAVEHETLDAPDALDLDEICRLAARQMLAVALEAERRAWLEHHADLVDETGRQLVVGNGYMPERTRSARSTASTTRRSRSSGSPNSPTP